MIHCGLHGSFDAALEACVCEDGWQNAVEFSFVLNSNGTFQQELQPCTFNEAFLKTVYIVGFCFALPELFVYLSLIRRWSQLKRNFALLFGFSLLCVAVGTRIFAIDEGFGRSRAFVVLWALGNSLCASGSIIFVGRYVVHRNKMIHGSRHKLASPTRAEVASNHVLTLMSNPSFTTLIVAILTLMALCFIVGNEILLANASPRAIRAAEALVYLGLICNLLHSLYSFIGPMCFLESFIHDLKMMVKGANFQRDESVLLAVSRIKRLRKVMFVFLFGNVVLSLMVIAVPHWISLWSSSFIFYMIFSLVAGDIILFTYSSNRRRVRPSSTANGNIGKALSLKNSSIMKPAQLSVPETSSIDEKL